MFNLQMLDVLIGPIRMYVAFSVLCTPFVESFATLFKLRSKNLAMTMAELLDRNFRDGEKFVDAFFTHPQVQTLSRGRVGRPSYIASELVGKVLGSVAIAKAGGTTAGKKV